MRKVLGISFMLPLLGGCFSLFSWPSIGGSSHKVKTSIDGKVFGTGTATFADWDTVVDADPSIVHVKKDRGAWSIGNALGSSGIPEVGFTFTIKPRGQGEDLASYLIQEYNVDRAAADRAQDTEVFGLKGVMIPEIYSVGDSHNALYATENDRCFYVLYVYGDKDQFEPFVTQALKGIRGAAGALPVPAACK